MNTSRTTKFGDVIVPVIERDWIPAPSQPYRRTYDLKPGQHWRDAATTTEQSEGYVQLDDGEAVPVGAVVARELIDEGASVAVFTELWGGVVLVNHDLRCVAEEGPIGDLLNALRAATGRPSLGGLPDVLAIFRDGRVVMRELKKVSARDKLRPNQHQFSNAARHLLGDRLDLAIVEWDLPKPKQAQGAK